MASAQDVLDAINAANGKLDTVHGDLGGVNNRLDGANSRLDDIKGKLDAVVKSVQDVNTTLSWGFGQLITIGNYTNQALAQNAAQNDTMICILEHISKNTCLLLNEAHEQTGLQKTIRNSTSLLADLYAATHAEAALTRQREEALRKQIEECCPPEVPPPPCDYAACPAPKPLGDPPKVDPRQRRG
jgi:DNA repair exonuclease SbcCD ATPase subunit